VGQQAQDFVFGFEIHKSNRGAYYCSAGLDTHIVANSAGISLVSGRPKRKRALGGIAAGRLPISN
ncbi:MAG: hypothetical protein WBY69_23500, partial [Candidatus Acidiferrales bacterium]